MRKVIFLAALFMMVLTSAAFAEEVADTPEQTFEQDNNPYHYTSEDFKFSILCPFKPLAVVENPWQEPEKRGEMLVFANEGFDILYAYIIQVNAFDTAQIPDFNKGSMASIGEYLTGLKKSNGFAVANLVNITKDNKGVYAVTADKIEVVNEETGEVEGEFVADKQYVYTFFRSPEGRCISIQLISPDIANKQILDLYRGSTASFKDNSADKKSDKNKKDKKEKDKKDKDKKDKKDKK